MIATKRCLVDLGIKLKIMGDSSGFGKNKIKQKTLFELSLFLKSNFEIIVFFFFFFTMHALHTPEQVRSGYNKASSSPTNRTRAKVHV